LNISKQHTIFTGNNNSSLAKKSHLVVRQGSNQDLCHRGDLLVAKPPCHLLRLDS